MWFVRCYWLPIDKATTFSGDNHSALRLVKNLEHHKCTQHIDIQYHYIRKVWGMEKLTSPMIIIWQILWQKCHLITSLSNFVLNLMASLNNIKTTSHINTNTISKTMLCEAPLLAYIIVSSCSYLLTFGEEILSFFHHHHQPCCMSTTNSKYSNMSQAIGVLFLFAHDLLLVFSTIMYEATWVLRS